MRSTARRSCARSAGAGRADFSRDQQGTPMGADSAKPTRKSQVDAILVKLPGVVSKKIGGLDGYFVNDRMFACISGNGVGLRLPVATARELQFSRENGVAFQPGGLPTTQEGGHTHTEDAGD